MPVWAAGRARVEQQHTFNPFINPAVHVTKHHHIHAGQSFDDALSVAVFLQAKGQETYFVSQVIVQPPVSMHHPHFKPSESQGDLSGQVPQGLDIAVATNCIDWGNLP
jgi:hypothetical protein